MHNHFSNFQIQMENIFKQLCKCLNEMIQLDQTIQNSKLSHLEIEQLMNLVDVKKKHYLDLNDIFDLVGNVTEQQLFTLFKALDTTRKGEIRVEQLMQVLGNPNLKSQNLTKQYIFPRFYTMVDTIKDKAKSINSIKQKYNFNSQQLQQLHAFICQLLQTKYLTQAEFSTVIKSQFIKLGLKWAEQCQNLIRQIVPGPSISSNKLIQAFRYQETEQEEEYLLSDLPAQPSSLAQKQRTKPSESAHKPPNFQESIIYQKDNKLTQSPLKVRPSSAMVQKNYSNEPPKYQIELERMEGNINSVLSGIQQRREKLRQDSLERKKIIESVINKKKQNSGIDWKMTDDVTFREVDNRPSNLNKKSIQTYLSGKYPEKSRKDYQCNEQVEFAAKYAYPESPRQMKGQRFSHQLRQKGQYFHTSYNLHRNSEEENRSNDISELLNKYSIKKTPTQQRETIGFLNKSKSGFIYPSKPYDFHKYQQDSFTDKYDRVNKELTRGYSNSKLGSSCKENMLKRAEEEAARKIEEIERKARMKVLEKRNMPGEGQWKRLHKRGIHF